MSDHPLLYGNNGSLDPSTYIYTREVYHQPTTVSMYFLLKYGLPKAAH